MNREHIGRKVLVLAAVAAIAFVCGWSALGHASGVTFAVALTVGVSIALFADHGKACSPRRLRRPPS